MHLGGSGPNFLNAGTFRWPSDVLITALLFTDREPIQVTGTESQGVRQGRDDPNCPAQTPPTSDEDVEMPGMKMDMSKVKWLPMSTSTNLSNLPCTQTPITSIEHE